jgi:hypothetical protein
MASKNTQQAEKQALIERIASSREQLSRDIDDVAESVDIPARIRSRIAASPLKIAASAAVAGLAGAAMLRRPVRTAKRLGRMRSMIGPITMFGLDFLRRRFLTPSPPPSPTTSPSTAQTTSPAPEEPLFGKIAKAFVKALKGA